MTPDAKRKLDPAIVEHMMAQVADTVHALSTDRRMMHHTFGKNVWIDWRFRAQLRIHQLRIEKRMVELVKKGLAG